MAKARLMTLVGAATVLAAGLTGASAQVLNLTGQFQCVQQCLAGPPAFAYLTQADLEMSLVNEAGWPSRGWIDYPGHIWVAAWDEGAFYSPDGMIIQFDNGSVWQRVVEVPIVAPVMRRHYRHSLVPACLGWTSRPRPRCSRRSRPRPCSGQQRRSGGR